MTNSLLILVTLFVFSLPILAQTPDFQMVKTEDGMIVVNNNKSQLNSFILQPTIKAVPAIISKAFIKTDINKDHELN